MGSLYIWKGTINADKYVHVLEQKAHIQMSFLWKTMCISARRCQNINHIHYNMITLKCPACSPDFSPAENIWCIIKWSCKDCYRWIKWAGCLLMLHGPAYLVPPKLSSRAHFIRRTPLPPLVDKVPAPPCPPGDAMATNDGPQRHTHLHRSKQTPWCKRR